MAKKATPGAPKAAEKTAGPASNPAPKPSLVAFVLLVLVIVVMIAAFQILTLRGLASQPTSAPPLACPPFMEGHPLAVQQSAAQGECVYGDIPGVTVTPLPEAVPTAAPTVTVAPIVPPTACRDGELILVHAADEGDVLDRLPVGEAERVDIMEISWPGQGFGGLNRAIIVIPRLGNVWQVNVLLGAQTVATRGFCGTNEAVADWAVTAHVPSLQQASRDANGNQPSADEIGVYRLDYEARTLIVVKKATAANAPTPEEVLSHIELSFHENGNVSNIPLTVAP